MNDASLVLPVTITDIRRAQAAIAGAVAHTPTIRDDAHPYQQRFGAGLRIITDLAAPGESRMIAVPGQSGNPLSPHFADLLQRWRNFDYLIPGRATAVATLTLEPAK